MRRKKKITKNTEDIQASIAFVLTVTSGIDPSLSLCDDYTKFPNHFNINAATFHIHTYFLEKNTFIYFLLQYSPTPKKL